MSIHDTVHKKILDSRSDIENWFSQARSGLKFPIYSSFDIRDSGCKIAPVDANIFPAGFNNICQVDQESSVDLMKSYLQLHYPDVKRILLFPEEHTNNGYYLDNVLSIRNLISQAGYAVDLALPNIVDGSQVELKTASGQDIQIFQSSFENGKLQVRGEEVDLIISNNDFSTEYSEFVDQVGVSMNPPYKLGWHNRKKDTFFSHYNAAVKEFSELIGITPCLLSIFTEVHKQFDINSEDSRGELAQHVDDFIQRLQTNYANCDVGYEPYVYVKNSAGTYGLGVASVQSGEEVNSWNNKARKKMKAAKGGGGFQEVILQEGIPTHLTVEEGVSAEPVIYLLGCQLAGGFLRTHSKKGAKDSLNSPGAVYKRLCVSDLSVSIEGHPMENVYGWIAKLGMLAIAREAKELGVDFGAYQ